MEKPEHREELSFCCSPVAVDIIDALVVEHRFRSRGELLREMVETFFAKAHVGLADLKRVRADHDRLNMVRPRRRRLQRETAKDVQVDAVAGVG